MRTTQRSLVAPAKEFFSWDSAKLQYPTITWFRLIRPIMAEDITNSNLSDREEHKLGQAESNNDEHCPPDVESVSPWDQLTGWSFQLGRFISTHL
jgi:hypothetical protein